MKYQTYFFVVVATLSIVLSGCFHKDDDNEMPTATASTEASAMETAVVTLAGSGTGDGMLSYQWVQKSGALAVITNASMANTSFIAPVLEATENLVFELTVTDEDGESASDEVSVMIDLDSSLVKYKVTVTNITNAQPLTPVAAILHGALYKPWVAGVSASSGLEILAESGSPRAFITDSINNNSDAVFGGATSGDPIAPGASKSVMIGGVASSDFRLSVATMLANTNDAFAGVSQWSIGDMLLNDKMSVYARVHDAGTEKNTESAGTIAGPADTSTAVDKGYSEVRDDPSAFVSLHSGVVSKDDGLASSVLNESHRWGGEAAKIVVMRVQ